MTELLSQRALARARELDAYYAEHKRPTGPLHGLPISVKEHVGMAGLDRNCAFVSWVGRIAESDAQVLKILWNAGCVFYVRTSEPQSLVSAVKDMIPQLSYRAINVHVFCRYSWSNLMLLLVHLHQNLYCVLKLSTKLTRY